jgi:shikimate kinase
VACDPSVKHLVLVGLMAVGKTTVSRLVAEELGRPLIDSDAQVEALTGRTVREIWHTEGEPAFRRLESRALAAALDSAEPSVIAAAGGVVLAPENRTRLMAEGTEVVWLRASTDTLLQRLRSGRPGHRPLLDDDPEGMLERMALDRAPLYEAVADRVVDVDGLTPAEVSAAVVEGLDQ